MIADDLAASDDVSSVTAASNSDAGTTRFKKPMRSASAASMRRPVNINSNAFFGAIDRSNGTVIMYGHNPTLISGVPKWLSSHAMTKQTASASPNPPANAKQIGRAHV